MKPAAVFPAAACLLYFTPCSHGANIALDILDRFNVITGNYSAGNETEGSAFVHGAYLPQGSAARFGFNAGQAADDSENMLWLANGVGNTNNTTLLSGSLVSRVTLNTSQFTLNGNSPGTPAISTGESAWFGAMQELGLNSTDDLTGVLDDAASQWAALTPNSTGNTPGNGSFTFNATPANIDGYQVAVFNVTAEEVFAGSGFDRLELNLNGAQTVLINVSGTNITVEKNFSNGFQNNESKVLFNFYEATSLNVNRNFRGGIFAPFANVIQGGSNFDGTVVASSLTQVAEIHDVRFDGYLPYFAAVPEPSSALLLLGGAGLLARRRRDSTASRP